MQRRPLPVSQTHRQAAWRSAATSALALATQAAHAMHAAVLLVLVLVVQVPGAGSMHLVSQAARSGGSPEA